MNDSEGESLAQKWSNSPGYTNVSNVTNNSPFKTPVSAKGGRTQKAKASKGRSCPPTPISNAGEKISFCLCCSTTFSIAFEKFLVPHLFLAVFQP